MATVLAPSPSLEVDRSHEMRARIPVLLCVDATENSSALRSALHDLELSYVQALDEDQAAQVIATTDFEIAIFSFGFGARNVVDLISFFHELAPGLPFAFWTSESAPMEEVVSAMRLGALDVVHDRSCVTAMRSLVSREDVRQWLTGNGAICSERTVPRTKRTAIAASSWEHFPGRRDAVALDGNGIRELDSQNGYRSACDVASDRNWGRNGHSSNRTLTSNKHDEDLTRLILGKSAAIEAIRDVIRLVAPTCATVMIHGESGVGKELVAKSIHNLSGRADKAFVPVNMAAIPEGLAESFLFGHEKGAFTSAVHKQQGWCRAADGGTLFLDEIGDLELAIQPKLLRFLQEGSVQTVGGRTAETVDVRLVTATNQDPRELVLKGQLREDLFFRLNVIPIYIPPLRERSEDIRELAELFLRRSAKRHERPVVGFREDALDVLQRHDWPGNVRQLENMVERLVIFAKGEMVEAMEIPAELHVPARRSFSLAGFETQDGSTGNGSIVGLNSSNCGSKSSILDRLSPFQVNERTVIIDALQRADGHVINAARLLGLGQATMYRKIKQYEIPHQRKRRKTAPK